MTTAIADLSQTSYISNKIAEAQKESDFHKNVFKTINDKYAQE
jgi:hypothetical protein